MHYVVAVDGSTESNAALAHALETAAAIGEAATVTVVHSVAQAVHGETVPVGTDASDAGDALVQESVEAAEDRGQKILDRAVAFAAERGHEVEAELLYGEPAEEIAEFAETADVDGLFVGHRGLDERYEELLGSTAKRLVERAPVPVTVVSERD